MVQGRKNLSLALEPRESIGILRKRSRQDFQCDVTAEPRIVRAIYVAHAATAKRADNDVRTKLITDRK